MPSLKDLRDDPKFRSLSPEAQRIVVDRLSASDRGFHSLSPDAQTIVRKTLLAKPETAAPSRTLLGAMAEPFTPRFTGTPEETAKHLREQPLSEALLEIGGGAATALFPGFTAAAAGVGELARRVIPEQPTGPPRDATSMPVTGFEEGGPPISREALAEVAGMVGGGVAPVAGRRLLTRLGRFAPKATAPAAPVEPLARPPQPPPPKAPVPKAPAQALPAGVTEGDVFARLEAIEKTTADILAGKESGRVVIFDPESLERGIRRPIGAVSGEGKTLSLVSELFDEVSAVGDVPPGKLLEAIKRDKNNPTFLRLRRAVEEQLGKEAAGELSPLAQTLGRKTELPEPFQAIEKDFPELGGPPETPPTPPRPAAAPEPPAPLTAPLLREPLSRKAVQAAEELFTRGGVQRDPKRLLSDQVTDLLAQGRVPLGDLQASLERHGLSVTEFSTQLFRPAVGDAGRRLQALSVLARRLKQAGVELPEMAPELDEMVRAMSYWRRADNIRRGLLVTQPATAIRNAITQGARLGLDGMQSAFDSALQRIFTPGKVSSHPADGLELLLNTFSRTTKQNVDNILAAFPEEHSRLFARYSSDIARAAQREGVALSGADKAFTTAEKAVDTLNILNRSQEWVFRRAVFQAKLAQDLRQKGMNLVELIEQGRVSEIPQESIRAAVNKSLEFTFAQSPKFGTFAQKFISLVNAAPFSGTLAIPFPRFLVNSLKFHLDFSPFGLLKLLSPAERAALSAGNTQVLSRAMLGTAMLGAAWQLRNSEHAGEKWYEVRAGGKTYDLRPFNPFAGYIFVADVLKRQRDGTLGRFEAKDIAQGILSANLRAGTGLFIIDKLLSGLTPTGSGEEALRGLKGLAGETAGGFLVPLQTLQDVLAEFDQNQRIVREKRQEPFLGPIKARIPGLAETLPEAEIPTRAGPLTRQAPLLRQTTGLIVKDPKNPLERELDRLDFSRQEVLRSTGEPEADRLIAKHMGELAERRLVPFVQSVVYRRLSDAKKGVALAGVLSRIREAARQRAMAENPRLFLRLRVRGLPQRQELLLQEHLGRPAIEAIP